MRMLFLLQFISLIYYELIYHVSCFRELPVNLLLLLPLCILAAGIQALAAGFLKGRGKRAFLWIMQSVQFLLFAAQLVYMRLFKQPLLSAAVWNGASDALSSYWKETIAAVFDTAGYLILLALPFALTAFLLKKGWIGKRRSSWEKRLEALVLSLFGLALNAAVLAAGNYTNAGYYENWREFYDPKSVMGRYGVLASVERDLAGGLLGAREIALAAEEPELEIAEQEESVQEVKSVRQEQIKAVEEKKEDPRNVLPIDFGRLKALSDSEEIEKLTAYVEAEKPSEKNEYTGFFEGYNLIYLTAEGFSPYAVDEELTPVLYRLIHSGFVVPDYYVPLWQTSTSDGEYVNLTGLIPDQQFSMKRSAVNDMPFSLPAYFEKEGVKSFAYHNNSLSYYDRHLSHPNLGYDFKASKLGKLPEEEWRDAVFSMENADAWPASDLDMMRATVPEYIGEDRFHVYYMTVSGHMNYNFTGNQMSVKNKDAVAGLPYSEEGKAYIACNMELDKALAFLIDELDRAAKLSNTVICLSADHYPYAMDMKNLEELAGRPLEESLEIYKNSLILWNSEMDTVEVTKPCSSLDLIPTLLNLFGFSYDSRLFAGRDILSDSDPLVVFADRSFITDKVIYNKSGSGVEYRTEEQPGEDYIKEMKAEVKNRNELSSGILRNNYYRYVESALEEIE